MPSLLMLISRSPASWPLRRLVAFALLLASCCSLPTQAATDQDKTATQAQIKQLKTDISKLQGWLDSAKDERATLLKQLKSSETDMGQLQQQIREQEAQLKDIEAQIKALEQKKKALDTSRLEQRDIIAHQLRSAYINGQGNDRLKMLLSQNDAAEMSRLWFYQNRLQQAHRDQLFTYQNLLDQMTLVQQDLKQKKTEQNQARIGMEARQRELAKVYEQRGTTLAALNKKMDRESDRLEGLQTDQHRLNTVLAQIEASLRAAKLSQSSGAFAALKGKLSKPLDGPILSRFGRGGDYVSNDGIVIGGPTGATVKAVSSGRVVFADWLRGFGLLLIIDHGQGYMSLYGHNETLLKDTGDWVQAGDAIATLGRSGGQQESSLYFAIRHDGKATDPQPWFKNG
ncbi:peptidase M23 [Pokkaliibacter plantistimulans]|uniref:Peptidase M23 n=2 Tax=Pseudomonadota TaxID=1224 RepID=A0A2S5KN38_9PROT|nr:peptidase M23 [Pokkaliibacter plantistimulans]